MHEPWHPWSAVAENDAGSLVPAALRSCDRRVSGKRLSLWGAVEPAATARRDGRGRDTQVRRGGRSRKGSTLACARAVAPGNPPRGRVLSPLPIHGRRTSEGRSTASGPDPPRPRG